MTEPRRARLTREGLLTLLTTGALLETAWTVYLGWRLPRHYVANHWDLAWVGLDSVEIIMLLLCAWAAWRRRAVLIHFASIAGTLLLIDAWFDLTTARYQDFDQALVGLSVEVPAALILFWMSFRTVRRITGVWLADSEMGVIPVYKIPIPPRDDESSSRQS